MNLNLRTEPGAETTSTCDITARGLHRDVGDISKTDIHPVPPQQPVETVGNK